MPRQARKLSGTGIYHVMLRGINRQDIFEDDEDYRQMVACLHSMTERYDEKGYLLQPLCTIYAYCLMSNHIHFLLREQKVDITQINERLWRWSTPTLSIDRFLLRSYSEITEIMNKEEMITEPSPDYIFANEII